MSDNLNRNPDSTNPMVTKKPSITADGTTPSIAITKLDIRPVIRENQDLVNWRNYTRNAEALIPRRALLYSLYFDVLLDGQVISVTSKRREAITTAKWQFVDKDGQPVEEINQLIDSIGFCTLLEEIIDSRFWGYSMVDCFLFKDDENMWQMTAEQFDRRHMRPELGEVAIRQTDPNGFSIREGYFAHTVLEAGKVKDLGLFLAAAQYAILKRGGLSDLATFVEVFGQPILKAIWDGFDENQRLELLKALEEMGNNGRIVIPAGTAIEAIPNINNSNGQLHDSFLRFLDEQLAKTLMGSTETSGTSERTGYAIGKVHADQDTKKNESDMDFVRRILNSRFIKILKAFGLPCEGGKFIIPEKKAAVSLTDEIAVYVQMANELGMPVDFDYIYEKTGMPKPADFDKQMAKKAELEEQGDEIEPIDENDPANTPPAKGAKKAKKPANAKLSFKQKMLLEMASFFASPRK